MPNLYSANVITAKKCASSTDHYCTPTISLPPNVIVVRGNNLVREPHMHISNVVRLKTFDFKCPNLNFSRAHYNNTTECDEMP